MFSAAITEIFEDFFSIAARYQIVSSLVTDYNLCLGEVLCYSFFVLYLSVVTPEVTNRRSFRPPFRIFIITPTATIREEECSHPLGGVFIRLFIEMTLTPFRSLKNLCQVWKCQARSTPARKEAT